MTDYNVKRDRWGRPLLLPSGKTSESDRKPYTRVSTLAKALDDTSGLMSWAKAMVAIGTVKERQLSARVASLLSKDGDSTYANNKTALRDITEKAMVSAGSGRAADAGTSLHEFTEVVDAGQWPAYLPWEAEGPLKAYAAALEKAGITVIDTEPFLAIDDIMAAGSMDKLLKLDGKVMGGDVKTGTNNSKYPLGVTCQVACYVHGERYDVETDERTPLHPEIDLSTGLLIELPREANKYGKFECPIYRIDLDYGWRAVKLALNVREARKIPRLERIA